MWNPSGIDPGTYFIPAIYKNDLTTYVKDVKMILYTDDTNILIVDTNEETLKIKLSSVMKQLEAWFYNNELILNIEKSKVMSFCSHQCRHSCSPNIIYNNMEITHSSELKFLRLTITNNLNWKAHIQTLCASLSKVYYILKSLKGVMSMHIIKSMYFAYFQARMKYGIVCWGTDCDSIKVFCRQKKVIRLIAGVKKYESCRQIFKDFKMLTMPSVYILEVLCLINKNKKNLNNNCHIHNHNTRSKCDLHVQSCNMTQLQKKSVINMAI
jgi:hypothetical protein